MKKARKGGARRRSAQRRSAQRRSARYNVSPAVVLAAASAAPQAAEEAAGWEEEAGAAIERVQDTWERKGARAAAKKYAEESLTASRRTWQRIGHVAKAAIGQTEEAQAAKAFLEKGRRDRKARKKREQMKRNPPAYRRFWLEDASGRGLLVRARTAPEAVLYARKMLGRPRAQFTVQPSTFNPPRRNPKGRHTKRVQAYQNVLAHLRAIQWLAWTSHWIAGGPNFYGMHLLLQRVYSGESGGPSLEAEIDGLGERMVAYFGPPSVNPTFISGQVEALLARTGNLPPIPRLLSLEGGLREAVRAAWLAEQAQGDQRSLGLDDFLMSLANDHDTVWYLLSRTQVAPQGQQPGRRSEDRRSRSRRNPKGQQQYLYHVYVTSWNSHSEAEWTRTVEAATKAAAMKKAWQMIGNCGATRDECCTTEGDTWTRIDVLPEQAGGRL